MKVTVLTAVLVILCFSQSALAGDVKSTTNDTLQAAIYVKIGRAYYKGDSIPNITLHTFYKHSPIQFKNDKARERYNRMVANIKYVYPIAQLAKQTLIETYDFLQTLPDEKTKKAHIAAVEKGVKEQYAPLVKKMSRSQGKLLVKLINRAFLGPFKAGVYQVFAGLYGNSLTKKYDPKGEDKFTERIVLMVESGQL